MGLQNVSKICASAQKIFIKPNFCLIKHFPVRSFLATVSRKLRSIQIKLKYLWGVGANPIAGRQLC